MVTALRRHSQLNEAFIGDFISNCLHYSLDLWPLNEEYNPLKFFDLPLVLYVIGVVVDEFSYDINSKSDELLLILEKILDDRERNKYHLNCFYYILHLFIKIDDERFLYFLDKYISMLNENNFFGAIGEELFLYFDAHKSVATAQLILQKHTKHKFDRLRLYLE